MPLVGKSLELLGEYDVRHLGRFDIHRRFCSGFATEMSRLQLEMASGNEPDKAAVAALADELYSAEEEWRAMLTRMV